MEESEAERVFHIRAADSSGDLGHASNLIGRRYASRGYLTAGLPGAQEPHRITLLAQAEDATIGTITVGFDGPHGLMCEDAFHDEIVEMRRQGRRVCEFTKLAVESDVRSKTVLASLFHVAYIYAYRVRKSELLLVEVNPRHVGYYVRMMGFTVVGEERMNHRVNAPAVLLCLDFRHADEQIAMLGGRPEMADQARSLYTHFLPIAEEHAILGRLCNH